MRLRASNPTLALPVACVALSTLGASASSAQEPCADRCAPSPAPRRSWAEATSGTALEEYLRALQLDTSSSRPHPQTIRALGAADVARMLRPDAAGPWRLAVAPARAGRLRAEVLRPGLLATVNSTFPFGLDDGALWSGRGLSAALDVGAALVAGPLTVRLQPVLTWSQNAAFPLSDESRVGVDRFRDPVNPGSIDLPQRYGAGAYHRLDYGDSEIRLDLFGLAAGVTNARETWGPAVTHPLILGPNAPGFAHGFLATARPVPVGIGRVHARVIAGRLDQSPWSPAPDSIAKRLGAGAVVSFLPWRSRSFEIGGTRFFHRKWPARGVTARSFAIPFSGFLFKSSALATDDPDSPQFLADNQLASAFVRWAPLGARVELYGEFARNDAALDVRELITEPDHQSAYTLGARRLFAVTPDRMRLARFEWVNARVTHLDRVRGQAPFYTHVPFVQGHTNRGKVLGSVAVPGGAGFVAGVDSYDPGGVTTVELHRIARLAPPGEGAPSPESLDVQYAARWQRTRFTRGVDLTAGAAAVWELGRDFRRDAYDLELTFGVRFGPSAASRSR